MAEPPYLRECGTGVGVQAYEAAVVPLCPGTPIPSEQSAGAVLA